LRLQLIRYESVELTEQLMREKQSSQAEDDDDDDDIGETEEECSGATPSELQVELRGVLLEEQRTEEPTASVEEDNREEGMLYVLTGVLSQAEEDEDAAQQVD